MQDATQQVRKKAIHDIWVALGRDHDSTDETVWPHQDAMRLPCPFVYEDEGMSLAEASQDSVDLIHAHYFGNAEAPDGAVLHSVTAFDLGDDRFYVIEFGGEEEILWAITPPRESRETFAKIERRWIEENIVPDGLPLPSDFEALDAGEPWLARLLTEALMGRGEAGFEELWDILSDDRELDSIDPDAVLAFWRKAVDHGERGPRTGPIPGLTEKVFDSPEFTRWLDTADLRWADTEEPIYPETGHALRMVCFYLAAPNSFFQGR
jgi:hypothetical protein